MIIYMNEYIAFYILSFVLVILELLMISPSSKKSKNITFSMIGFIILVLTTITSARFVRNHPNTLELFGLVIPSISLIIPLCVLIYIEKHATKHKEKYTTDDELYSSKNEKNIYRGVIALYITQTLIYLFYLLFIMKLHYKHVNRAILLFSIILFILLEVNMYFIWKLYNVLMLLTSDG